MMEQPVVRWGLELLAVALCGWALLAGWFGKLPTASDRPMPVELRDLAIVGDSDELALSLAHFERRLEQSGPPVDVLLLQAVPNGTPLVIATAVDSSGNEEPTHWESPFAEVNATLASGRLEKSIVVEGVQGNFQYVHQLFPVDASGSRILLVNRMASAPQWSLQRTISLAVGLLIAIAIWLTSDE